MHANPPRMIQIEDVYRQSAIQLHKLSSKELIEAADIRNLASAARLELVKSHWNRCSEGARQALRCDRHLMVLDAVRKVDSTPAH